MAISGPATMHPGKEQVAQERRQVKHAHKHRHRSPRLPHLRQECVTAELKTAANTTNKSVRHASHSLEPAARDVAPAKEGKDHNSQEAEEERRCKKI